MKLKSIEYYIERLESLEARKHFIDEYYYENKASEYKFKIALLEMFFD